MTPKHPLAPSVNSRFETLVWSGVTLGILAGAAISTYVWRHKMRAALNASPDQKADKLIESCERKLERIEKLMRDLQEKA